jgi:hypothetical protein
MTIIASLETKRSRAGAAPSFGCKKAGAKDGLLTTDSYCQRAKAGIYCAPHLPPLTDKVSQVEMEAGDCEGRLPPLFLQWDGEQ